MHTDALNTDPDLLPSGSEATPHEKQIVTVAQWQSSGDSNQEEPCREVGSNSWFLISSFFNLNGGQAPYYFVQSDN